MAQANLRQVDNKASDVLLARPLLRTQKVEAVLSVEEGVI